MNEDYNLRKIVDDFYKTVERTRNYDPISSPGLMFEVLKLVQGTTIADIGCGGGLFGHIAKAGWYHSESYKNGSRNLPFVIGIDINRWSNDYRHNYDALIRGLSTDLQIPDKSIDTLVCIENLEHLMDHEIPTALDEFERVTRKRIIITTPSPLYFMSRDLFMKRAYLLPRIDIHIDKQLYTKLASAIHKHCVDPRALSKRDYYTLLYNGDWKDYPIYVKDVEYTGNIEPFGVPLRDSIADISKSEYDSQDYVVILKKRYPINRDLICKYSWITLDELDTLIREDIENGNFRIYYLNLVCESIQENDSIDPDSKEFFEHILRQNKAKCTTRKIIDKMAGIFRGITYT